ncbi:MAG: ABC transporter ATP-binding protein [SAR324 cluster bacterium]|nr:ABC transporter ATP-binding protein [SAR324 cluster bacterium]
MAIEIENLWKEYFGSIALNGISLKIEPGKVLGVLGENGAGKSTLFRILAGVTRPTRGRVTINGIPIGKSTRSFVSYLPDVDPFDTWMSVREMFQFLAVFYPKWDMPKAEKLLDFMKVDANKKIKILSKGQKVRLKLVCAIAQRGDVILMDEPLGGIDPISRRKVMEVLFEEFRVGKQTILIATHLVEDVEAFLDEVVYLREGDIALSGSTAQLKEEHGKSLLDLYEEVLQ